MKHVRIAMSVIGAALVGLAAEAGAETFTLQDVYTRVREKNEDILIARETVRQAEEGKVRARSELLPSIKAEGTYQRAPEETTDFGVLQARDAYDLRLTFEQPLFAGGKGMANLRKSRRELDASRKDLLLTTEQRLLRTAALYYEVLKAQKDLEAQQRNVERLLEHRRISELRFEVGEVTRTVLLRAEAELADARAELTARENALAVGRKDLKILADLPEEFSLIEPPLPEVPFLSGEAGGGEPIETALSRREDVLRSELQERIAEEAVKSARGAFFPTVTLEGAYFFRDQDPESAFFIDESWYVGGRVELSLFEGGLNKADYAQAKSRLYQEQFANSKIRKDVDLDVTNSNLTLKAIVKVLESRKDQVRFASENYDMVSRQFTFGLATNTDLLDANQTLIEAERDMIAATYDHHLAILDVQRSLGLFLKNAVGGEDGSM